MQQVSIRVSINDECTHLKEGFLHCPGASEEMMFCPRHCGRICLDILLEFSWTDDQS